MPGKLPKDEPKVEPAPQHLHDETKRPLKAPIGGVPPNIAEQFPGKGGKGHFGGQTHGGGRNFRHQGR
jgi:hypothetical protein